MSDTVDNAKRLIVALNMETFAEMKAIVEGIGEKVSIYKIGHQLFTSEGPKTIAYLKSSGKSVFLDLKLHEIPHSAASAVVAAGKHGVDFLTVHASGGKKMMQAAVEAATQFPNMKILALTVVTGLSEQDLEQIGFVSGSQALVLRLAKLAKESGCHGVVASPKEIEAIRSHLGAEFLIVAPAIRSADSDADDQQRVGTPQQAFQAGASFLIVGRPVVQAENPALAAEQIIAQMQTL